MANTELLFLSDTFQFEVPAQISFKGEDSAGHYLVTDRTIFYPGGGGQEPDKGLIEKENGNSLPVIKVTRAGHEIRHYYEGDGDSFEEGENINLRIDEAFRLQNAKLHTGGHLLASVVYEELKWPFIPVKGFHYQQGAYIEFNPKEEIVEIDEKVLSNAINDSIQKQLPVTTCIVSSDSILFKQAFKPEGFIVPEDQALRLVKIGGYLASPCGGTHLHHTGELNFFRIKHIKHKKRRVRISYEVG